MHTVTAMASVVVATMMPPVMPVVVAVVLCVVAIAILRSRSLRTEHGRAKQQSASYQK
jgi:hypothetical protein